jgi:hypothetical protein
MVGTVRPEIRLKIEQNLARANLRITAHILAQARSAVNKSEVILEVGGEGGITLYGLRDPVGWRPASVLDKTPSLLPGEFDEPGTAQGFRQMCPSRRAGLAFKCLFRVILMVEPSPERSDAHERPWLVTAHD